MHALSRLRPAAGGWGLLGPPRARASCLLRPEALGPMLMVLPEHVAAAAAGAAACLCGLPQACQAAPAGSFQVRAPAGAHLPHPSP